MAFLINHDKKISKSAGNFKTVNELLKIYSKETLRFYLLSGHHRSPLEFNEKLLGQAEAGISRIFEFKQKLDLSKRRGKNIDDLIEKSEKEFTEALDDDLNTPKALAVIFNVIREINPLLIENSLDKKSAVNLKSFLEKIHAVLGIIPSELKNIPDEIKKLVETRDKLRQENNFQESDKIRTQIRDLGWEIEDTIYGTLIINK